MTKQSVTEISQQPQQVEVFAWEDSSDFSNLELPQLRSMELEIKDLCLDFDPYQPVNNLKLYKAIIVKYQLESVLSNPFLFTNKLLRLMDKIEQALKSKIQ